MAKPFLLLSAVLVLNGLVSQKAEADEFDWTDLKFAAGVGVNYTGIGASAGYTFDNTYLSASSGIMSNTDRYGELFGVGVSYQRTDLLQQLLDVSNKHALGLYAGSLGSEVTTRLRNGSTYWRADSMLGLAATYNYFFNGIEQSGFHVGFFTGYSFSDVENTSTTGVQIGYRF
ncbi:MULTISPECIES: hypothetical protein [Gammaproteobacteria]|uniref:hypothetical protein n=1 Tax=Gammaproteobacteria TaxID=1236 RepID=UPI000DCFEEC5|nr:MULTISPECIES: hypothetical protein [Gammaproteobacteria]RTE86423.1 hypothetical protein DQX04_07635 [Aliidiomarina sp. B3213]TCZ81683.1 hypothetical protein EYQ95_23945 [Lysobacter sp. N42]